MAVEVGIGALVDSLFFAPEVLGAAEVGADVGLGLGAADLAGAGALGAEAAGGVAAGGLDLGAIGLGLGAAEEAGAGAAAGSELAAGAGLTAADVLGGGALASDLISPEVASIAGEQLGGGSFGADAASALADAAPDVSQTQGIQAINAALKAAPAESANVAAAGGGVTSPAAELATGPENINAALGVPSTPATAAGPTTQAFALANQSLPTAASNALEFAPQSGSEVAASSQVPGLADVGQFAPAQPPLASAVPNAAGSEIAASSEVPALISQGAPSQFAPSIGAQAADAAAGGAAAAAPPSFLDTLGGVAGKAGSIASNPLVQMGLPAAFLGYNLLKGPPGVPAQAQEAINNARATDPALAAKAGANIDLFNQTAANDLNLANNFQISPAQAASINTWVNDRQNELRQQIARQQPGVDYKNSSQWIEGNNQIQQQALGMQTQMINQLIQTAFTSASAATNAVSTSANVDNQFNQLLMQAAQLQVQQDASFNSAVGAALQSFGLIAGLNASKFAKGAAGATA
jgi:hypothetical protein